MTTTLPTPFSTPEKPAILTTQAHHDLLPLEFFTSRHRVCPFAQRVDILLHEHFGEDAEQRFIKRVEIDLNEPRPDWYLRSVNPLGKVPAIRQHSGEVLWESMVILEYLCERLDDEDARKVYWPSNAHWRAKARLFMKWFSDNFVKAYWKVLTTSNEDAETLSKAKMDLVDVLKELNKRLVANNTHGPFYQGQHFTLVDIFCLPFLLRLPVVAHHKGWRVPEESKHDVARVQEWIDKGLERESVSGTTMELQSMIDWYKKYAK